MNSQKIFLHVFHFSLREHEPKIQTGSQIVIGYPLPGISLFRAYLSNSISFSWTLTRSAIYLLSLRISLFLTMVPFPLILFLEVPYETEIKIIVIQQEWMRLFQFQHGCPDFASSQNLLPSGLYLFR